MPKWTTQQNNAITARGRNILVSAAAGSGKTAVLVERVIKLVTDKDNPVNIDDLLIVTFTNAAAAEMKSRISKSLTKLIREYPDEEYYRRQLSNLSNADICTIDAFCIKLVKEYFYELNISQDITVMDESELSVLQDNIILETIDRLFAENDPEFISLVEAYTQPGIDKPLISIIKRLLRFIYAQPFPFVWLNEAVESSNPDIPFEDSIWYCYIKSELEYLFSQAYSFAEKNGEIAKLYEEDLPAFSETVRSDISLIESVEKTFNRGWDEFIDYVNNNSLKFVTLPRTTKLDEKDAAKLKRNRDLYKIIVTKEIPSFALSSKGEYTDDMKGIYPRLKALYKLVFEVDKRLLEEKAERNSYSFSDIEHFAINLLFRYDNGEIIKTDVANVLSDKYYEILVDEYQDTNEAQDLLFSYLSNGKNLFTVGDMKQSIYRFRLAMPNIFNDRRKKYSAYDENSDDISSKIILDKNFRSRKGICDYVNFIFSHIMSEKVGEIDYTKEEYLYCGATYKDNNLPCAYLRIIDGNRGEGAEEAEANYIASIIQKKVNSGELIQDGEELRPVRYGDFAILMRSLKKYVGTLSEVLKDRGIPVICDNSNNLFENNEIKMLLSLLRTVNNPTNNIALLATMLSPFYGFTEQELAEIKNETGLSSFSKCVFASANEKVKSFVDDIKALKKVSVTMSVAGFIRYLIEDKGLIAFINALGNGEQRYQNIVEFIRFADRFDKGTSVGLTAFIRYIDKIIASERQVDSASVSAGSTDAVTIMSVHHSKGLEFPICILAGAARRYNKSDLSDNLLLNTDLGIAIKSYNSKGMYRYKTLPYTVIADKNDYELMSENLRVLYVAMTRAKEQFITVSSVQNLESRLSTLSKYIDNGTITPYSVNKIGNDSDYFLMCSLLHKDGEVLRDIIGYNGGISDFDFDLDVEIVSEVEALEKNDEVEFLPYNEETVKAIKEKLNYTYDRKSLEGLSSKLTASSLDDTENSFEYLTSSKPAFLNKNALTPAQRGTAMHNFMQFCSYDNSKTDLEAEIKRCVNMGFITSEQADSLDRDKLVLFFESELFKRMAKSGKIYREIKVSKFYPANEVYDTEFTDEVLIQGIADCVFEEDGKLVLVDYKTDRVKDESELLDRYKKQIGFYKNAISEALNLEVKEALLYSFSLNKCCYYK